MCWDLRNSFKDYVAHTHTFILLLIWRKSFGDGNNVALCMDLNLIDRQINLWFSFMFDDFEEINMLNNWFSKHGFISYTGHSLRFTLQAVIVNYFAVYVVSICHLTIVRTEQEKPWKGFKQQGFIQSSNASTVTLMHVTDCY